MDHQFLEFMGNFFLTAATGQKQADRMLKLMHQWVSGGKNSDDGTGFDELTALFNKSYGLLDPSAVSETAARQFEAFSAQYWELFRMPGMVPEKKYRDLKKKCEHLTAENDSLKKTITVQASMLALNDTFQNNISNGIESIMENQHALFKNMLTGFSPGTP